MLAPQNELTSAQGFPPQPCPPNPLLHEHWDIHRAYGSGYPSATIRDGFLELYFTDDSLLFSNNPCPPLVQWRVRIPVAQIETASAYVTATRQTAPYGTDIKWSPLFRRYFAATFFPMANTNGVVTNQVPKLVWSPREPDAQAPASFPDENCLLIELLAGRWAASGGILGDGNGNTVDFFSPPVPESYSALHLFYEEMPAGEVIPNSCDFGHTLVLGYPPLENVPPTVAIEKVAGDVHIFWPLSAAGWLLDQSLTATGPWSQVAVPFTTNATSISLTVSPSIGNRFYRLRKP